MYSRSLQHLNLLDLHKLQQQMTTIISGRTASSTK
jgi:hypothetical protein